MKAFLKGAVKLLRVLIPDGQGQIQIFFRSSATMRTAIDVWADEESEEFLDPEGILMWGLYCIKQFAAEFLYIMLLEGLRFSPLKTP